MVLPVSQKEAAKIAIRPDANDVGNAGHDGSFRRAQADAILRRKHLGVLAARQAGPQALHGLAEPGGLHRLEHVVDCVDLKGPHGVLGMRGDKNHEWRGIKAVEQVEAGGAGHLDVEKDGLRLGFLQDLHRLAHVTGLAHDLDPGHLRERPPQPGTGQRLVVDDADPDHGSPRTMSVQTT
jgi:hypothetical protein